MTRTDEADWTEREEQNELEADSRLASAAARLEELLRREAPLAGHLYIVGTPLGNLGDMTPRALGILAGVDWIAAEDTRHSADLLRYFGLRGRLLSYHEHNWQERGPELLDALKAGKSVALVSDAGMPAISDPGQQLCDLCLLHAIPVRVVPGPAAATSALALSGLDSRDFRFIGFLPVKGRGRLLALDSLRHYEGTTILYEAPHRVLRTLEDLAQAGFGERTMSVCRELTKQYEEVRRATVAEHLLYFADTVPRGEFVLILAGPTAAERQAAADAEQQDLETSLLKALEQGLSDKDILERFGEASGLSRNRLKRRIRDLRDGLAKA